MQAFLQAGLIPNSLMKTISQTLAKPGEKAQEPDMTELMADIGENPEMLQDMLKMADSVTVYCVVEPKVQPAPETEAERKSDLLYVDEVDMEDKLFIMNFGMGGSRDLEPFRQATAGGVGSVPTVPEVQQPPKPVAWNPE